MEEHGIQQCLAEFIERETEYWDFWGAIRIVKDGEILWETSRGYANAEFGVRNTMDTRFTIASVTKQFTAFAVMLLYDKGLLSLNAEANTYLPEDLPGLPPLSGKALCSCRRGKGREGKTGNIPGP